MAAANMASKKSGDKGSSSHSSSEKTQTLDKSKNVSHVPCKFFRQSICQAGDKCPFSHDTETDTQTVCKYFQRGNCKFGSKCALAHITPDGKHMNKKTPKSSTKKKEKAKEKEKEKDLTSNTTAPPSAHATTPKQTSAKLTKPVQSVPSTPASPSKTPNRGPKPAGETGIPSKSRTASGNEQVLVDLATQILSKYNLTTPSSPYNASLQPQNTVRSLSATLPFQPGSSVWSGTPHSAGDDFAIADDDDEDNIVIGNFDKQRAWTNSQGIRTSQSSIGLANSVLNEPNDYDEEEGYTEQLIPSTLEDLLTPLERERRNSRNSQQKSGRVFSSPSLSLPMFMGNRRGSSSSEPIGDLWGPRNTVTPFNRNTHFGSPPLSSSQLVSSSSSALSSPVMGHASSMTDSNVIGTPKQQNTLSSTISLESHSGVNPWGLSNFVIRESEEQSLYTDAERKGLYQPFQQYQANAYVSADKI